MVASRQVIERRPRQTGRARENVLMAAIAVKARAVIRRAGMLQTGGQRAALGSQFDVCPVGDYLAVEPDP